ncbi:MAG: hypothetical protein NTZ21_14610 [Actinobacteria bacterium]|nr:hypothetical protein [Actinomycetota bacterium]
MEDFPVMKQAEASAAGRGNATAVARVIVFTAAATAIGAAWVLGVSDKETCSEAFGVMRFGSRTLAICNWVAWFLAIVVIATLVVLLVSLRDINRHGTLRRVPFYLLLFAAALACYVVPSISLGFR